MPKTLLTISTRGWPKWSKANLRNIKLTLAYDGTDFSGWQRQSSSGKDDLRTVQGAVEGALCKIHKMPAGLTGCGRTDAGVHAAGQVANFYTNINSIKPSNFVPALNALLPKTVRVLEAEEVPLKFHARFDAVMRTYRYYFCSRPLLPTESRYCLQLRRHPRLDLLNAYGRLLLGETDCKIFAAAGDKSKSSFRLIKLAHFFIEGDRLVFEISANAFMMNMARSLAGTFLFYEEKNTPPSELARLVATRNRSLAGPTLPPCGLFLWKAEYGEIRYSPPSHRAGNVRQFGPATATWQETSLEV